METVVTIDPSFPAYQIESQEGPVGRTGNFD
jgi:hypothetical protein